MLKTLGLSFVALVGLTLFDWLVGPFNSGYAILAFMIAHAFLKEEKR